MSLNIRFLIVKERGFASSLFLQFGEHFDRDSIKGTNSNC